MEHRLNRRASLVVLVSSLACAVACMVGTPSERFEDDEIATYCLLNDGVSLEVTFAVELRGECMIERETTCVATLDDDGVVRVAGLTSWRENDNFCSNTLFWHPTAACALPAGWEDASFELAGAPFEPPGCNR